MKKLVAVLLALAMILTVTPAVFAATDSGNWMIAEGATYEWTAPASGSVSLYTENMNSIAVIDANGEYLGMGMFPSFDAVEGAIYTIQHFGTGFDIVYWELTTAEGEEGGDIATSGSVEVESYSTADWTAPMDGYVQFTINIPGASLAIVQGYAPVAEGTDSVVAKVTAGTTYLVAPGFDVTTNSVVDWMYVDAPEGGDEGGEAGEVVPNGGALVLGDNNVELFYATMPAMAANWTYLPMEDGVLTVTVTSINGETNLGMAFGRGVYTVLAGESDGMFTNTVFVNVFAYEPVQIAVLDTMDMTTVPAVINLDFVAGGSGSSDIKNPADYFETNDMDQFIIPSLVEDVEIFSGDGDVYFTYTAEFDDLLTVTPTVGGYAATSCAISVNGGELDWSAAPVNVVAGDVVIINVWGGYEGIVSMGEAPVVPDAPGGEDGGDDVELNPDDYFEKNEEGYYVVPSLTFGNVGIFVGNDDITYVYTAEADGIVSVIPTVEDTMTATNCWIQHNDGGWDTTGAPVNVVAGDKVYINIWSGYEGVVCLETGDVGGDDGEKVPADYFDQDENGNYIIPSLEENVEIFVGNDDINYIYTAEVDDILYVTATVDAMTATNCWIKVNDGGFETYTDPVAVSAGDVVIINIWSGYEGIVSLGEAAEVPGGDDEGGDEGEIVPNGGALALGFNNVELTYATMPMMAANWTYTAEESGYLTVMVYSINGNTELGRPFGMNMYTLLAGDFDGMGTNSVTVFVNAGDTVPVAVLDSVDFDPVPAELYLSFSAGEPTVEKDPADYFEMNDMEQFIIPSLIDAVEVFSGNGDYYFIYTAEADGAVYLTSNVEGNAATNCAISVNYGEYKWGTAAYAVNVAEGDTVIINLWSGFDGVAVLGEHYEGGDDEGGDDVGGEEGGDVEEGPNPGDYFDRDENGNYIIPSLEYETYIFVGNDDINYIYVAEADGTLSVNCTVESEDSMYIATQCWIIVNGDCTYSADPVEVKAGDVILINIWGGYEGTVTLTAAESETGIVINAQPADAYFVPGDVVTFTVDATNVVSYTWQWRKSADDAWTNANAFGASWTTASLSVPANYETNAGRQFKCILTDAEGNTIETEIATLCNKVADITITYGGNDPVVESKAATYVALGNNAVSYQWFTSSDNGVTWNVLKDNADAGISGATSGRLVMPAWSKNAGMLVKCKMYDAEGAFIFSEPFTVKIAENPLVNSGNPTDQWAVAGKDVSFTFEVTGWEGEGEVQYRWQTSRDGVNFGTTTLPSFDQATFTLAAYSSRENVWVRCVAIAPDGNKIISEPAQIKIIPNPLSWAVDAQNVTAAVGTTAEFHVVLQGFEGTADQVSYRWQYQRTAGGNWETLGTGTWNSGTDTLQVPVTAARNGWRFRCIATDYTGQQLYSEKVTLTVG